MGSDSPRMTGPTLKIIGQLITAAPGGVSGAEISRSAKIPSGTLYPVLFRLERAGWLESEWEDGNPSEMGRPRRRLYRLTSLGRQEGRRAFEELIPDGGRLVWQS
jgi:DNA-binding MarR family transcriptional regulator